MFFLILSGLCGLVILWYCTAIAILHRGLRALPGATAAYDQTFSIVIAARNEEKNIAECLDSVLGQTIKSSRFEIIVVNDRSEDSTAAIVNEYCRRGAPVTLLTIDSVPAGISPKKHAVIQGIKIATKEIVVFTDADCRVPATWLDTIDHFFSPETGLVQGITTYHYIKGMNTLFFGLQAVDFLSHGIVAAAAIGSNLPINSNANNMAFRKSVFVDIGGYGTDNEQIVSGDDDLLLQKVWRSKTWKVAFMADPAGAVTTVPTSTFAGVFEQRKRWGSKTIHYSFLQMLFLTGIFLFYCTIVLSFLSTLFNSYYGYLFGLLISVKVVGEMFLMIPGTAIFDKKELRQYLVPASLLQLPVVVFAVLMGAFGTFSWKGENFHRKIKI